MVEQNSRTIDHLQAADIAAGLERETLDGADINAVALAFDRVWLNGCLVIPNPVRTPGSFG